MGMVMNFPGCERSKEVSQSRRETRFVHAVTHGFSLSCIERTAEKVPYFFAGSSPSPAITFIVQTHSLEVVRKWKVMKQVLFRWLQLVLEYMVSGGFECRGRAAR